ncbi:MAG: CBS domain-containing protein [bacterium]|nr:CBS domain-containing protein [bacterium]
MENMTQKEPAKSQTTNGLTLSPALDFIIEATQIPSQTALINHRVLFLCGIAIGLGAAAALVAQFLVKLIAVITNLAYFGQFSFVFRAPADAIGGLGWYSVPIPILGAVLVGFMARYGSQAIRGHGIPEAMEQVLTNDSKIPMRVMFLKPISSAIAIGTGGPFGAEGPIIATGSALGSVVGQSIQMTASERKTMLAAGAAAGMAAIFGSPVSAVLIAIELLLFEFRPQSIIPVALASCIAAGIRMSIEGTAPVFAMTELHQPSLTALFAYLVMGGVMGVFSTFVTRSVYWIEDQFEKAPIHWMWWPAIGSAAVGVIGVLEPDTLGVGYYNISSILSAQLPFWAAVSLCLYKFISWSISLSSGTSGGTLAPLFTIGGGVGLLMGIAGAHFFPAIGIDPRIAALVGMAAIFAGASRAMLTSVVFAFETTLQPFGLLPLLGGCAASYLVSAYLMQTSIMTEKIARRGVRAPEEYSADLLDQVLVRDAATRHVKSFHSTESLTAVRNKVSGDSGDYSHQGYPIINQQGFLSGMITRKDLMRADGCSDATIGDIAIKPVKFVYEDSTVRQAADHMVNHSIGRLPVLGRGTHQLKGIIPEAMFFPFFNGVSMIFTNEGSGDGSHREMFFCGRKERDMVGATGFEPATT